MRPIFGVQPFPLDSLADLGNLCAVYRNLDPEKIVETVRRLRDRIQERFPEAGLARVAAELLAVSEKSAVTAEAIAKPLLPLRLGIGLLVMGGFGHSRLQERILGGVTRDTFASMTILVLMSH